MPSFSDFLAAIAGYPPYSLTSRQNPSRESREFYRSLLPPSVTARVDPACKSFQSRPSLCERKAEDGLFKPAVKQLKMRDPNAPKANLTPIDSDVTIKSQKSTLSSSSLVAPIRKRKAEDGLPLQNQKTMKMCKEGTPRVSLDSKEFGIAESSNLSELPSTISNGRKNAAEAGFAFKDSDMAESSKKLALPSATSLTHKIISNTGSASKDIHRGEGLGDPIVSSTTSLAQKNIVKTSSTSKGSVLIPKKEKSVPLSSASVLPKTVQKAGSTSKDAQLGSKSDKPAATLTTSSRPHRSTVSPGALAKPLQDPNSPPPKVGSYRELMSRKASDMIKRPPSPVYTGKQIKEAAKAAKMQNRAPRREFIVDPEFKLISKQERKKVVEKHKRLATERANQKFPRRAYNGTGVATVQASSVGTASLSKTSAPLERRHSSGSVSTAESSGNDMEAGYMDVEDEESRAALTAKREDEEEAQLEAALKRAKERRKMRQAQVPPR